MATKRFIAVEKATQSRRKLQTPEERAARLALEAQAKRDRVAADDAAVDRMIRRNIELYGP